MVSISAIIPREIFLTYGRFLFVWYTDDSVIIITKVNIGLVSEVSEVSMNKEDWKKIFENCMIMTFGNSYLQYQQSVS